MFRLFVFGIFLGVAGAGALAYSVPVVDLHREASHIAVRANGGNAETFRINLPDDRIMVGLAGADNALPAGLDWPGEAMVGNLQAEIFKVRDRNDIVIGVASRLASASERTGRFIEWTLHLPARGTVYLKMDLAPTNQGYRNGTLIAGTREFDAMNGNVRVDEGSDVKRPSANTGTQLVIATGKAAWRNVLPINAGFNGLSPSPPNNALPRPTATNPPTTTIHNGSPGGSVNP